MTNREKYNQAYVEVFGVEESVLNADFSKENVDAWDSVHQLNIIAILEEAFDIMITELYENDIMELQVNIETLRRKIYRDGLVKSPFDIEV